MNVLHLIDTLDGDDCARQLELIAPELARRGCRTEVCCIGPPNGHAATLRQQGVSVRVLGWTRWLDGRALWHLRALVRDGGFDIIQVWRLSALRMLAVVARDALPRVIVSAGLPLGALPWWDRQLLRRVRCLVVGDDEQRRQAMQGGLGTLPWRAIPCAASVHGGDVPPWTLRYPQRIACAGQIVRGSGFREAVWAVDILRYVLPDVHLLIAGAGPFQAELQSMIDRLAIHNAHLLGDVNPSEVLAAAHVCWVPSHTNGGAQSALDAMTLGRAVVASDVPALRAVIRHDETGILVPRGDPLALARETRALLIDPSHCQRLGSAARAEVAERFALATVAARWRALYNDMAA